MQVKDDVQEPLRQQVSLVETVPKHPVVCEQKQLFSLQAAAAASSSTRVTRFSASSKLKNWRLQACVQVSAW